MAFEPRMSLVTLGVADVAAATAFYARLGFSPASAAGTPEVTFIPLNGGMVLALYGRASLAADAALTEAGGTGFGGIMLAYNARSEAEVDRLCAEFTEAGGTLSNPPAPTAWGGYCGYAVDPDGHSWEIAFNPHWPLGPDGAITLPV
jgi:predicted lactoylglutathione lyase